MAANVGIEPTSCILSYNVLPNKLIGNISGNSFSPDYSCWSTLESFLAYSLPPTLFYFVRKYSGRYFGRIVSSLSISLSLVGTDGFEPATSRVKVYCLTTWRRPSIRINLK